MSYKYFHFHFMLIHFFFYCVWRNRGLWKIRCSVMMIKDRSQQSTEHHRFQSPHRLRSAQETELIRDWSKETGCLLLYFSTHSCEPVDIWGHPIEPGESCSSGQSNRERSRDLSTEDTVWYYVLINMRFTRYCSSVITFFAYSIFPLPLLRI